MGFVCVCVSALRYARDGRKEIGEKDYRVRKTCVSVSGADREVTVTTIEVRTM